MGKLTWSLIAINVVIFEIVFSMPHKMIIWVFNTFSFSSVHILELWRLITSLFLHASASHLFFNMLGLYFFGKVVEDEIDVKQFIFIYLFSGIVGNLVYGLTSTSPVVGASGCVFGLMGVSILWKPKEMIRMYVFPLPLGLIAFLFIIAETLLVYYGEVFSGIAHVAHVAGFIFGSLFAFYVDVRTSLKGVIWMIGFALLLSFLGPIFSLIIGIGSIVLSIVDRIVGFFLYGIAKIIGIFIW